MYVAVLWEWPRGHCVDLSQLGCCSAYQSQRYRSQSLSSQLKCFYFTKANHTTPYPVSFTEKMEEAAENENSSRRMCGNKGHKLFLVSFVCLFFFLLYILLVISYCFFFLILFLVSFHRTEPHFSISAPLMPVLM